MRIGRIAYLNTEPFFWGWNPAPGAEFFSGPPRQLAEAARQGAVDCAPLPVVDCWKLEREFEPLGPWGIAVGEAAGSVLLFSKEPIERIGRSVVGVTDESSTSAVLLDVLLRLRHGAEPRLVRGFSPGDRARLLIGDEALTAKAAGLPGYPFDFDLGREWTAWQRRPFVFARWVVRRSLHPETKEALKSGLASALARGRERLGEIAHGAAARLGVEPAALESYLRGFRYEFGEAEEEGLELFRQLAAPAVAQGDRPVVR